MFALLLCAALLGYFQLRAKALSPAIAEARLQALQARIRPHFLFNSINAVLSLIRSEPKRAETALEDMADLFRVLMRDNRELAPLADEVELCRQYLALEQLRLGDRLQVEWHVKNMPGDALVPPLVLQPLLENAVYHGIEPRRSRAWSRSTSSTRAATCTRSCAIPTGPTAAATTPATRWRSPTSASGWRCTSTPRRASRRACAPAPTRCTSDAVPQPAGIAAAARPAAGAGGPPWLTRRCAS